MKIILIYLSILSLVTGITFLIHPPRSVDGLTYASCIISSKELKHDFKGTEFANRPFLEYCIDNIEFTSPLVRK